MNVIEILQLFKTTWPGVVAIAIWGAVSVIKAWLACRRTCLRIGNCEIDAPSGAVAVRVLREYKRIATSRQQAQLPVTDSRKPTRTAGRRHAYGTHGRGQSVPPP